MLYGGEKAARRKLLRETVQSRMKGFMNALELVKGANLTPCFLLELRALSALGYWGFN